MHLGSLESTQEARVALGCASSNSYASLVLNQTSRVHPQLDVRTLKHEPIVKQTLLRVRQTNRVIQTERQADTHLERLI